VRMLGHWGFLCLGLQGEGEKHSERDALHQGVGYNGWPSPTIRAGG
jgi:hypothetical protein